MASGMSRLGDGLEGAQIHVSFPLPQACPLAAVRGDPDSGICKMDGDAKGFPKIQSERPSLEEIETEGSDQSFDL